MIDHGPCCSTCVSANKLDVLLDVEKHNSDGEIESKATTSRKPCKNKKKSNHGDGKDDKDKDDHNFSNTNLGPESSSNEYSVRVGLSMGPGPCGLPVGLPMGIPAKTLTCRSRLLLGDVNYRYNLL